MNLREPQQLTDYKAEWAMHHAIFNGIVRPKGVLREFHRSQLDGLAIKEEVRDGHTYLTLAHYGRAIARARYRYDESLVLQWEGL